VSIDIPLTKGAVAIVDEEDYDEVSKYKWYLSDTGYALRTVYANGTTKHLRMHRVLIDAPSGKVVDHLNRNPLDNRKSNLRICTPSDNAKNRITKGYTWSNDKKKYLVRHGNKFYCYADTIEEAIRQSKLAKSGVPKTNRIHRRRQYIPKGVYYMQPNAQKGLAPYYIRPQINGKRHFNGYFSTVAEAKEAYELTMAATGGMTS
jgi:hypothetical protein